jgi:hypothetical protein
MPYDPGPQRRVKVAAFIAALDHARTRDHDPPVPWATVADRLAAYEPAQWRTLSVAAGRPDRKPSAETITDVLAAVSARVEAEAAR